MRVIEAQPDGKGLRVAVVASRFNDFVAGRLCDGAVAALRKHGVADGDITVIRVAGAWEIPLALRAAVATGRFDAAVAVGAVIKGGTPHFEYVSNESIQGTARLMLESGIPVGLGIITTNNVEQAVERSGDDAGNKGAEAAAAAIETANVLRALKSE